MVQVDVGARLRHFRQLRGWSQERLALEAGINPAFLGHLERGLKSPTITTLEKLVAALDITFEELFAEERPDPEPHRAAAIERLLLLTRDLPVERLEKLTDLVQAILNLP